VAAKQNLLKQAEKLEGTSPDVPKFFGSAEALPSQKPFAIRQLLFATRYSLLAIRCCSTIRQSPFTIVF
jgi:hypothetical protein